MDLQVFNCTCYYCLNDITAEKLVDIDPPEFWEKHRQMTQLCGLMLRNDAWKSKFKILNKLWELISEVSNDRLSYRVDKMKMTNETLVAKTASNLAYPCIPGVSYM